MSKIVDTDFGQFRQVTDGKNSWFLLQCPDCGEMLQLTEAMLQGTEALTHESQKYRASYCSFSGTKELGKTLVAALQVRRLFEESPWHDEGESHQRMSSFPPPHMGSAPPTNRELI